MWDSGYMVPRVLFVYVIGFFLWKQFHCYVTLLIKSNLKTRLINFLQDHVYFQPFGLLKVLSLDGCTEEVLAKREKGYKELKTKLVEKGERTKLKEPVIEYTNSKSGEENKDKHFDNKVDTVAAWLEHSKGAYDEEDENAVAGNMADCRFKKVKVLGPLLKELEVPQGYASYVSTVEKGKIVTLPNTQVSSTFV